MNDKKAKHHNIRRIHMSSEKDALKNPSNNETLKMLDFSLQSIATKPYDMSRIMGKSIESKDETTATQSALQQPTSQEGK